VCFGSTHINAIVRLPKSTILYPFVSTPPS
jgi:hypothetical protein